MFLDITIITIMNYFLQVKADFQVSGYFGSLYYSTSVEMIKPR